MKYAVSLVDENKEKDKAQEATGYVFFKMTNLEQTCNIHYYALMILLPAFILMSDTFELLRCGHTMQYFNLYSIKKTCSVFLLYEIKSL